MKNRLVVGDASWADMIPKWLLDEVAAERMVLGLAGLLKPGVEKVGDAEVAAYLMPATMRAPIPLEYVNIYLYLTGKLLLKKGKELPDDLKEQVERGLTRYEEDCLKDLRHDIYRARGGEIDDPLLEALRGWKKRLSREEAAIERREEKQARQLKESGQGLLFGP